MAKGENSQRGEALSHKREKAQTRMDPDLLRRANALAAMQDRHGYEVIEEAVAEYICKHWPTVCPGTDDHTD